MADDDDKKQPGLYLYTGDWLKDPALSRCCPATRGIWADLLCAMHESDESGFLTGTPAELSRMARCSEAEMKAAIEDLARTGAADITLEGRSETRPTTRALSRRVTATSLTSTTVVTVVNRRMHAPYKARVGNRLRQKRRRSKDPPTDDVTPLSRATEPGTRFARRQTSTSLSSSSSTSKRRQTSVVDALNVSKRTADQRKIAGVLGTPATAPDRSLEYKAAVLVQVASEHLVWDALEAVRAAYARDDPPQKPRHAYFHGVLKRCAAECQPPLNLNGLLASIPEPTQAEP